MIYGAIGGGLPPGVTEADISGPDTTICAQCGGEVPVDQAVYVSYTEQEFCDLACLAEWVADNAERVARWIAE